MARCPWRSRPTSSSSASDGQRAAQASGSVSAGQAVQRRATDRDVALGRHPRHPQHDGRVAGDVGLVGQLDHPVGDHDPGATRSSRPTWWRVRWRQAPSAIHTIERPVADTSAIRSSADAGAELGRHRILVLEAQHVAGAGR